MNKWVKKSIDLADSKGYLDNLFEVYPIELGAARYLSPKIKVKIREVFNKKNRKYLIKELLGLPRFPIDDPYTASLRKYPLLLDKNPLTVDRLGKRLFSMGLKKIYRLASQPKSPSRQLGDSFRKWLRKLKYPFLEKEKFLRSNRIAFLEGSDKKLKKFAYEELGVRNLKKGIDFILKIKNKFILGEAKFLTTSGGTQNNQFRDAIKVAEIKKEKIIGIAVLDGIVWFKSKTYMHRTVKRSNGIALSALLLEKFIRELRKI